MRPIAPKPEASPGGQQSKGKREDPLWSRSRKNTRNACQACKKKKTKCSGEQPCANCIKTEAECLYSPDEDGRASNALKRKHDELLRDQYLLDKLLDKIQQSDDHEVRQIVSLIRSQASLEDVKASVRQQILDNRASGRESNSDFASLQDELDQLASEATEMESNSDRRKMLDIHRLTETPVCSVPAAPWTTVTDDDDLVSHLISTWLIHDKNWFNWVDEAIFIEDMLKGELEAECCSPFLVNAILAWVCPYSDWTEARTQQGALSALAMKFLDATKQYLEGELAKGPSLTLAQGLLFLWFSLATGGRDAGYQYMTQAISVTQDLIRSHVHRPAPTTLQEERVSKAIDHMVWGVYNSTTASYVSIMKPQWMVVPQMQPQLHAELGFDILVDGNEFYLFSCDISPIVSKMTQLLFDNDSGEPLPRDKLETAVFNLHEEYRAKVNTMPDHLKFSAAGSPTIYAHHLFNEVITLRSMMTLKHSTPFSNPDVVQKAQGACVRAALRVATRCGLYMDQHNDYPLNVVTIQPCMLSLFVLLEIYPSTTDNAGHITTLSEFMRRQSRRWPLALAYLRMVQLYAKAQEISLPPETEKLFEEFETRQWKRREQKRSARWRYGHLHSANGRDELADRDGRRGGEGGGGGGGGEEEEEVMTPDCSNRFPLPGFETTLGLMEPDEKDQLAVCACGSCWSPWLGEAALEA